MDRRAHYEKLKQDIKPFLLKVVIPVSKLTDPYVNWSKVNQLQFGISSLDFDTGAVQKGAQQFLQPVPGETIREWVRQSEAYIGYEDFYMPFNPKEQLHSAQQGATMLYQLAHRYLTVSARDPQPVAMEHFTNWREYPYVLSASSPLDVY